MGFKYILLLVVGVLLVLSVAPRLNRVSNPSWELETMGTWGNVTISGPVSKTELRSVKNVIGMELEMVNRVMSTWQSDTELSRFNALESTEPFAVSAQLIAVVNHALQVAEWTDGAFDPTVKPLVDHWGFGPETDPAPVAEIMESVGWRKVSVLDKMLVKSVPELQLDLSAIAKGYGVDRVADVLRLAGFENFLVEIGGEVVAEGANPKGKRWQVGVENPRAGEGLFQALELSGRALATSGDYRNFRIREDGTRYSHIINPSTGMPAESDVASVSVLAPSCMDADALATALFVMGAGKGLPLVEARDGVDALFILHSTNKTFVTRATSGFPDRGIINP